MGRDGRQKEKGTMFPVGGMFCCYLHLVSAETFQGPFHGLIDHEHSHNCVPSSTMLACDLFKVMTALSNLFQDTVQ